ncbi:hypothetical protein DL766_009478 [Monosporascus sp. MC13-8B]|uniref:Cyanovirin-N domain-containing protein n=1 Tax=Monosporascus cannonballus TaxID=155416 RepID=A0ABY0H0W6_9PEZI|nr:hypothetical protein DL762_008364 [Monosporascus cannonballus]RYP15179.1 hypothetical protein DL766_009478 [Monosporascus sp. MC13-8B]
MRPTMTLLGRLIALVLTVLGVCRMTAAQDFVTNCTWKTARMVDSYLGMYCNNDNWAHYSYGWTWFDTAYCVINNGGVLAPYYNGNYWPTCVDCFFNGSDTAFLLTCICYNVDGITKLASTDLNEVIWNHNGSLGCYNHVGNYTEVGPI